ncbi:MAG TPA: ferrochelatase [Usitatibacteraceae bacterium]|nr:ferrochelatase [Usitatibacteraceae bacterium]
MSFLPEPPYTHGAAAPVGILLVNLGTPDAPTAPAVRRYLREFLWDPRVVEKIPRAAWWLILHGIILVTRPAKSAAKYASVWTKDGSPLRVYLERQAQMLRGYLGERVKGPLEVVPACRYGNPSITDGLAELRRRGCDRVLVLPLYPQYAASTTGSVMDAVGAALSRRRNVPGLRLVRNFHDHPAYVKSVAAAVNEYWARHGRPDRLVMSFHGLPRFSLDQGDPYHCECLKTARLVATELGWNDERTAVTFQSRFGWAEWLKPYTAETLETLGRQGTGRVDVICPGFASDCLETLEEIAMEGKETFLHAGGKEFHYIPTTNDRPAFVAALTAVALENLGGWVAKDFDRAADEAARRESASRARALGAGN